MKKLVIIFFSVFLISSCTLNKQSTLIAHVSVVDKIDLGSLKVDHGRFYSVKIDLTNCTDSTLHFWVMSCSWQLNWVSKDHFLKFYIDCRSNFPELMQLEPNKTKSYSGIIELLDTTDLTISKEFWLGFVLIKRSEVINDEDFHQVLREKKVSKKDIFWSDSFRIDK